DRGAGQLEAVRGPRSGAVVLDPGTALRIRTAAARMAPHVGERTARLREWLALKRRTRHERLIRLGFDPLSPQANVLPPAVRAARHDAGLAWRLWPVSRRTLERVARVSGARGVDGAVRSEERRVGKGCGCVVWSSSR